MSTTHRLPPGQSIAPMPRARARKGRDRVLPGGLPPAPNRTSYGRWTAANRAAGEPFVSRTIRMEVLSTRKWLS